jgi:iron(III) transport system permease protein
MLNQRILNSRTRRRRLAQPGQYLILLSLLALLGTFLIYPIILTVSGAFFDASGGLSLTPLRLVFEDPSLRLALVNSLVVAMTTTVLATCLALPLALFAARYQFPLKGVFSALILVPLILPPFVGAIGTQMLLGRAGALNALLGTEFDIIGSAKFFGVVLVQSLSLYPIIYLNATAALANLDPALDEAAENLGAGPIKRFFTITLPLIRPGLFAGATIVFIWSFTELGTPLVFDYNNVLPVQIFNGLKELETSSQPYALTVVMLLVALMSYVLGKRALAGRAYAMYSKASRASSEMRLSPMAGWGVAGAFGVVTLLALMPHVGVILTAMSSPGQWYRTILPREWTLSHFQQALGHPDAFGAIRNSLQLAVAAVIVDLALGLLVGYIVVRTKLIGRNVLDALCMLPLAVPGLVMAFGYVAMTLRWPFGKDDIFGGLFSVFGTAPNPVPLLIIAYSVRRLPYIVRATVAGLEQTSSELEEAAVNLGASRFTAVRRVIVPLIAANLIAGGLLVFSFSMLEVSDSLLLAQQQDRYPITKAIFMFLNRLGDGPYIASAMGVWGMALLTVTLVGASILLGRKLGSIFRV